MAAPERKPFLLRIPPELLREMEKWAADELRSVNGQIEFVLRQALARRKKEQPPPSDDDAKPSEKQA